MEHHAPSDAAAPLSHARARAFDATSRFSDRVEDYVRSRPGYPLCLTECLNAEFGLRADHVVADIGSGTGISSEIFLKNGNTVVGVEPNREMRLAGERLLAAYPRFRCVDATAEETTLPDATVDWVVSGQAFHWLDVPRCRTEFARILRPSGKVALFWNNRRHDTPFLVELEGFIRTFAVDYEKVRHEATATDGRLAEFFGPGGFEARSFPNPHVQDFDGLKSRILSASYMPNAGHPRFAGMIGALQELFERHARDKRVCVDYDTLLYVGRPG